MNALVNPAALAVLAGLGVLLCVLGLVRMQGAPVAVVAARTAVAAGTGSVEPTVRRLRPAAGVGALQGVAGRLAHAVTPLLGLAGQSRLEQYLTWVGGGRSVDDFRATQVLMAGALMVLGVLIATVNGSTVLLVPLAAGGAAVGWWLPAQQLESRYRAVRAGVGRSALGFADFLVAAVQAGLPLEGAVERLSGELPGRLPELLARAVRQAQVTREPLDLTLETLAAEVDEPNLTSVVGAIAQARQTGGDLAGPLAGLVGAMRQERQQQLRAAARGRAAYSSLPLIFVMLPGVMAPLAYIVMANFRGLGF